MPALSDLQRQFLEYLTGEGEILKSSVVDQGNVSTQMRLNIYKNAYQLRLTQALETDHEILGIYLGDELFEQMALGFIAHYPSAYKSLRYFGEKLPAYLKTTEPFSQHPYISELALFERRLLDVFDAGEGDRLLFSALQEIPSDDWPDMKMRFHPSTQLFVAGWNSVEIWKALKAEQEPAAARQLKHAYWLLWRGGDRLSEFRGLEDDEYTALSLAIAGHSFARMCESLLAWHEEAVIGSLILQYVSRWFEQGLIVAIDRH